MEARQLINFLNIIEKLKCNTRHCWTSTGRHESIAEHSWRLAVMVLLVAEEFPELDIEKVVKMSLIHDFGEAITGDIPSFDKTEADERAEELAITELLQKLPPTIGAEFKGLFQEMSELQTGEAKLFKALDNLEAILSHNEASIDTWIPREYTDNLTYGTDKVAHSTYLQNLKEELKKDSLQKIKDAEQQNAKT